jgi:hypothetical protein
MKPVSPRRLWLARGLAVTADTVEIALLTLFSEGFASPAADLLDVVMCGLMTWLLGWHLAFLPSVAVKLVPVADLAPCWTLAVWLATRPPKSKTADPEGRP